LRHEGCVRAAGELFHLTRTLHILGEVEVVHAAGARGFGDDRREVKRRGREGEILSAILESLLWTDCIPV
jgi:hypothetical protein